MSYPLISVVIPSLNQGQYIEETIISILGQQYPNLEIIIMDGGSTDNTVEILKRYSSQISYWASKKDNGQADAINRGMSLSSGEILCWLNSDDMYLSGTLLDIGRRFYGRTDRSHLIYGASVGLEQSDGNLSSVALTAAPFEKTTLTYYDFIVQPSAFWTRKLWQCAGELNTNYEYVLDWDWFIRASEVVKFEYVPRFYSVYRLHPLHKSRIGGAKRRKEVIDVVKTNSSKYWEKLYIEVDKSYPQIRQKSALLDSLRIPKRRLLLPLFFPRVMSKLRKIEDLYTVLKIL
jgi:glycosyltransferase involved in cell wall biosynthesis